MNKVTRRLGTLLMAGAMTTMLVGCGSKAGDDEDAVGQLALPLVTRAASGDIYRLRNASFEIHSNDYYYYDYAVPVTAGTGGTASGGSGAGGAPNVITVSSEDDPDASNISVALEEGQYFVQLLPGWHFEKEQPGGAVEVEATLLSDNPQWVYVSRQYTSSAEYRFGLGDRELWLNGQLNIDVVVHENPDELYGTAGAPGTGGSIGVGGGMGTAGTPATGGAYPYFTGTAGGAGEPSMGTGGTASVP